jgi:hypothetical protein
MKKRDQKFSRHCPFKQSLQNIWKCTNEKKRLKRKKKTYTQPGMLAPVQYKFDLATEVDGLGRVWLRAVQAVVTAGTVQEPSRAYFC